ncbi:MAG: hypothetical protein ACSLEL_03230 [Candidatus Malihini olakiniferum]
MDSPSLDEARLKGTLMLLNKKPAHGVHGYTVTAFRIISLTVTTYLW